MDNTVLSTVSATVCVKSLERILLFFGKSLRRTDIDSSWNHEAIGPIPL